MSPQCFNVENLNTHTSKDTRKHENSSNFGMKVAVFLASHSPSESSTFLSVSNSFTDVGVMSLRILGTRETDSAVGDKRLRRRGPVHLSKPHSRQSETHWEPLFRQLHASSFMNILAWVIKKGLTLKT